MAIQRVFTESKDVYTLKVLQDTQVKLEYVSDLTTTVLDKMVYNGNTITLPTSKDGFYKITLSAPNNTDVIIDFEVVNNLQLSVISDICSILVNTKYTSKACSVESKTGIDLMNFKNIMSKLLVLETLWFPKIGENLTIFFNQYLVKLVEKDKFRFYTNITTILNEECSYGDSKLNSQLFKTFLIYYYIGMYNIDKNIAGSNVDELAYVEDKYSLKKIVPILNDYCITLTEANTVFSQITSANTPPTVDDYEIVIPDFLPGNQFEYDFTGDEFTENFTDIQGNLPLNIRFFALPVRGDITFKGNPVTKGTPYPFEEVTEFHYSGVIEVNEDIFDLIIFQISDDNVNETYSDMATVTMNSGEYVNKPISQLGNLTVTKDNRTSTVYTINHFTTQLNPPYEDPEGDSLDAIRIDSLPTQGGTLTLNGTAVTIGQIISAADINAGLLVFNPPNQNAAASSVFSFSARDTGSLTFVS